MWPADRPRVAPPDRATCWPQLAASPWAGVSHWWNKIQPTNAAQPSNIMISTHCPLRRQRCCRCHLKSRKGSDSIVGMPPPSIADTGDLGQFPSWPLTLAVRIHTKLFGSIQTFKEHSGSKLELRNILFLLSSPLWGTKGKADELRPSVVTGLRKGLSLIRGMRRSLTENEQHKIAGAIVEHLEQSNWKIKQGPTREGHGPHLMSK
jgi:hypothetical protein